MRKLKLTLSRQSSENGNRAAGACWYNLENGRGERIERFCPQAFHAATGFTLKPGESQRIEITIKKVKK